MGTEYYQICCSSFTVDIKNQQFLKACIGSNVNFEVKPPWQYCCMVCWGFSLFYKANFGVFYTLALTSSKNHMVNVLFADT